MIPPRANLPRRLDTVRGIPSSTPRQLGIYRNERLYPFIFIGFSQSLHYRLSLARGLRESRALEENRSEKKLHYLAYLNRINIRRRQISNRTRFLLSDCVENIIIAFREEKKSEHCTVSDL